MNNYEKNTYVKEQITQALLTLLQKKKLNEISVSELTDFAGVGRVSFYRNYTDMKDILFQYDMQLIKKWGEEFEAETNQTVAVHYIFESLFRHYQTHSDFYLLLYKNNLTETMLDTIIARISIEPDLDDRLAYWKSFFAYGLYGWLLEWMKRGMPEDAATLNEMLRQSILDFNEIVTPLI